VDNISSAAAVLHISFIIPITLMHCISLSINFPCATILITKVRCELASKNTKKKRVEQW